MIICDVSISETDDSMMHRALKSAYLFLSVEQLLSSYRIAVNLHFCYWNEHWWMTTSRVQVLDRGTVCTTHTHTPVVVLHVEESPAHALGHMLCCLLWLNGSSFLYSAGHALYHSGDCASVGHFYDILLLLLRWVIVLVFVFLLISIQMFETFDLYTV